jgi:hypothetical protein
VAGTLRAYIQIVHELLGKVVPFGSLSTSVEVATPGTRADAGQVRSIAAGATVEIYNWVRDGDFEAFGVKIVGSGYLHVYEVSDIPTAVTLVPAGTGPRSSQQEISNLIGYWRDTDQVRTEPAATVSKTYSLTGYSAATGTGTPDLIASVTAVTGKVYSILLRNPGSAAVSYQKVHHN